MGFASAKRSYARVAAVMAASKVGSRRHRRPAPGRRSRASECGLAAGFAGLLVLMAAAVPAHASHRPVEEYVTMSDGTRLYARVELPDHTSEARFPFVIIVDPYGAPVPNLARFRENKLATVFVHVRGTGHSEGSLAASYLSEREIRDTLEIIEHYAKDENSTGRVGLHGVSYSAVNAMLAAVHPEAPPALQAVAAHLVGSDLYRDVMHWGGILNFSFWSKWSTLGSRATEFHQAAPSTPLDVGYANTKLGQLGGSPAPTLEGLEHVTDDDFWRSRSSVHRLGNVRAPVMVTGGWRDLFIRGTVELYRGLVREGVDARLWVDPCSHVRCGLNDLRIGEDACKVDFYWDHHVAWFKRHLRDEQTHNTNVGCPRTAGPNYWTTRAKPVSYFVQTCATVNDVGTARLQENVRNLRRGVEVPRKEMPCETDIPDQIRQAESWPPEPSTLKRFVLQAPDAPAIADPAPCIPSSARTGALVLRGPAREGSACYATNPAAGLSMTFDASSAAGGAQLYFPLDQRAETASGLTWRSADLKKPLILVGSGALRLRAASTATDTDWYVVLSDVAPTGEESIITRGQLRASHRQLDEQLSTEDRPYHTHSNPTPIEPGKFYRYDIELWPTAYRIDKGHRLQLRLASVDLPSYLPGTFKLGAGDGVWRLEPHAPAINTVRHGGPAPSALLIRTLED